MTNADRIRSATDKELAELFESWIQDCDCNSVPCRNFCVLSHFSVESFFNERKTCFDCWLDWLRQEVDI